MIALVITLGLWFFITGQQAPITSRFNEVRLNFRVSGEMEITNEPSRQVEITLTGDKGKLNPLDSGKLVVSADLSARGPGEWLVDLRPSDVIMELPAGVKIDKIQPDKVLVKLERREEREVEVKPEFEGQLPDGMEIYEKIVSPANARVQGPSSFVNSIDTISTEKIPLDNRKADFTVRQVAINLINPKVTVLDTVVDVMVKIGPKRSERNFTVHAQTPSGVNETIVVTLIGVPQELDKIDNKDIRIEWEKMSEDTLRPRPFLPDDFTRTISVKNIKPSMVTVKQ